MSTDGGLLFSPFGGDAAIDAYIGRFVVVRHGRQEVIMPVLNQGEINELPNVSDVNTAIARAHAKACAIQNGIGIGLWLDGAGAPAKVLRELGVGPGSDLSKIAPITNKTGAGFTYVPWAAAWIAAKIVHPGLWFRAEHKAMRIGNTYGVVVHLGAESNGPDFGISERTFFYPVMGQATDENGVAGMMALVNPDVRDFNRTVARCVARAIALTTGYGISVYADESISSLHVDLIKRKSENERFKVPATSGEARAMSDRIEQSQMRDNDKRSEEDAAAMSPEKRSMTISHIRERMKASMDVGASDYAMLERINVFIARSPGKMSCIQLVDDLDKLSNFDIVRIARLIG